MPEWYSTHSRISFIKCFITDSMEPYVMVKHTPQTPFFDTRFGDYGYDKVSFIEQLRQMNYQMYIFSNVFAMDYPHPVLGLLSFVWYRSSFRIHFAKNTVQKIEQKYKEFYSNLIKTYNNTPHYPICRDIQNRYYFEVDSWCVYLYKMSY